MKQFIKYLNVQGLNWEEEGVSHILTRLFTNSPVSSSRRPLNQRREDAIFTGVASI